ncbi:pentapeptide repeat-containing protein [Actinophytocola oryzae]|uniref:Pentapeptide repeat protein n=1 Tax=Actinophytocola oryzae TaxID=502181 RepID=A0A4R7V238_9PSEU|nr:pentapeptide repeat-containing protein [Actinophytocola oryzae]TDV42627.1 pentapeptide repeat protein [Actinophytocola oryzae]
MVSRPRRVLAFAAVVVGVAVAAVVVSVLVPAPSVSPRPVADPLGRATVGLGSPDLGERLAAIHELEGLMWRYESPHQPAVMTALSAFVRERSSGGCGHAEPDEDVEVAMSVLGHRAATHDEGTVMDLHGVCLAGIVMTYIDLANANLADADLTGATFAGMALTGVDLRGAHLAATNLRQADLADADLTDADLAGADLTSVRWSDGTEWPQEYAQAVQAASAPDGSGFVIGDLRL